MIMDTKQFCKAVRIIAIKKHKAKLITRYTFGTSGDSRMFTTFGKRKTSFNFNGSRKQFNLIRKDLVNLLRTQPRERKKTIRKREREKEKERVEKRERERVKREKE